MNDHHVGAPSVMLSAPDRLLTVHIDRCVRVWDLSPLLNGPDLVQSGGTNTHVGTTNGRYFFEIANSNSDNASPAPLRRLRKFKSDDRQLGAHKALLSAIPVGVLGGAAGGNCTWVDHATGGGYPEDSENAVTLVGCTKEESVLVMQGLGSADDARGLGVPFTGEDINQHNKNPRLRAVHEINVRWLLLRHLRSSYPPSTSPTTDNSSDSGDSESDKRKRWVHALRAKLGEDMTADVVGVGVEEALVRMGENGGRLKLYGLCAHPSLKGVVLINSNVGQIVLLLGAESVRSGGVRRENGEKEVAGVSIPVRGWVDVDGAVDVSIINIEEDSKELIEKNMPPLQPFQPTVRASVPRRLYATSTSARRGHMFSLSISVSNSVGPQSLSGPEAIHQAGPAQEKEETHESKIFQFDSTSIPHLSHVEGMIINPSYTKAQRPAKPKASGGGLFGGSNKVAEIDKALCAVGNDNLSNVHFTYGSAGGPICVPSGCLEGCVPTGTHHSSILHVGLILINVLFCACLLILVLLLFLLRPTMPSLTTLSRHQHIKPTIYTISTNPIVLPANGDGLVCLFWAALQTYVVVRVRVGLGLEGAVKVEQVEAGPALSFSWIKFRESAVSSTLTLNGQIKENKETFASKIQETQELQIQEFSHQGACILLPAALVPASIAGGDANTQKTHRQGGSLSIRAPKTTFRLFQHCKGKASKERGEGSEKRRIEGCDVHMQLPATVPAFGWRVAVGAGPVLMLTLPTTTSTGNTEDMTSGTSAGAGVSNSLADFTYNGTIVTIDQSTGLLSAASPAQAEAARRFCAYLPHGQTLAMAEAASAWKLLPCYLHLEDQERDQDGSNSNNSNNTVRQRHGRLMPLLTTPVRLPLPTTTPYARSPLDVRFLAWGQSTGHMAVLLDDGSGAVRLQLYRLMPTTTTTDASATIDTAANGDRIGGVSGFNSTSTSGLLLRAEASTSLPTSRRATMASGGVSWGLCGWDMNWGVGILAVTHPSRVCVSRFVDDTGEGDGEREGFINRIRFSTYLVCPTYSRGGALTEAAVDALGVPVKTVSDECRLGSVIAKSEKGQSAVQTYVPSQKYGYHVDVILYNPDCPLSTLLCRTLQLLAAGASGHSFLSCMRRVKQLDR